VTLFGWPPVLGFNEQIFGVNGQIFRTGSEGLRGVGNTPEIEQNEQKEVSENAESDVCFGCHGRGFHDAAIG
jgi:hypothetical protein